MCNEVLRESNPKMQANATYSEQAKLAADKSYRRNRLNNDREALQLRINRARNDIQRIDLDIQEMEITLRAINSQLNDLN